jgi:C1A family cysteine protease
LFDWLFRTNKQQDRIFTEHKQDTGANIDDPDKRDFSVSGSYSKKKHSIRPFVFEIKNQGALGSCVPHAFCSAYEIMYNIKRNYQLRTSELFLYYYGRIEGGFFPNNSGTYLRDVAKVMHKQGTAYEQFMPYSEPKYNMEPGFRADLCAAFTKIKSYARVYNTESMRGQIEKNIPVIISMQIDSNFSLVNSEGILPDEVGRSRGGHAMLAIGYDDDKQAFEVLNSWGREWGNKGTFWLPYTRLEEQGIKKGYTNFVIEI